MDEVVASSIKYCLNCNVKVVASRKGSVSGDICRLGEIVVKMGAAGKVKTVVNIAGIACLASLSTDQLYK